MKKSYLLIILALACNASWAGGFKKNLPSNTNGNTAQLNTTVTMPPNFVTRPSISAGTFSPHTVTYFAARGQFADFSIESSNAGLPTMIKASLKNPSSDINVQINQYLTGLKDVMHIVDPAKEFVVTKSFTDDLGITHYRMKQVYQGLTVYDGEIILHVSNGIITMMNGRYFATSKGLSTSALKSEDDAKQAIAKELGAYKPYVPSEQMSKIIKTENYSTLEVFHANFSSAPVLCWHVTYQPGLLHTWEFYIDASTGTVLSKYDRACSFLPHPPANGTGTDLQGANRTINCYNNAGAYYMLDASRAMFNAGSSQIPDNPVGAIWVLDFDSQPQNTQGNVSQITSGSTTFSDPKAVSAYYNASTAYEYYLNTHTRNSIDGQGGTILSFINVADDDGTGLDNAYWNGQYMFYGNGKQAFTAPLQKDLDVGGHEMTHGVVQNTANLEYKDQSGAMNESFADVFGTLIEGVNWTIGEHVSNPAVFPTGALRDLSNPHNGGTSSNDNGWQPANMNELVNTNGSDNGGVHVNSGIPNYAFYLFANDAAVGKANAGKVYYRALSTYLVKSSQFVDLRDAVLKSVQDLFAGNTNMLNAACSAFDAVGITGAGGGCNGNTTPSTHQDNLPTNPGTDYILFTNWADNAYPYFADASGNKLGRLATTAVLSKPSVNDDGSSIVFVGTDHHIHLLFINYATQHDTDIILSASAIWRNVAISKDGNRISALTEAVDSNIYIYDFTTSTATQHTFPLYNPTTAEGVKTGGVKYADAMEWDYTSQWVMYDCFSELHGTAVTIDQWDIGFLHAWGGHAYADGTIQKLFSNLPDTINIGNPIFSKNSPFIISFDEQDVNATDTTYYTDGANIESGDVGGIISNDQLGYPNYSKSDNKLIFDTDHGNPLVPMIGSIDMNADKITATGGTSMLIDSAYYGVWIAAGTRALPSDVPPVYTSNGVRIYPNPFSGMITINPAQESDNATIIVTDLQGREVFTQANKPVITGTTIDLSHLTQGVYILQYRTGNNSETVKIVKM